jgi:hypothetical protein
MGSTLTATPAAEITARLDRLPMTRHMGMLVLLISVGGWFDTHTIFLTGSIAPAAHEPSIARGDLTRRPARRRGGGESAGLKQAIAARPALVPTVVVLRPTVPAALRGAYSMPAPAAPTAH